HHTPEFHQQVEDWHPQGGDIVTSDGTKVGNHTGIHKYTIGQRRGLGVSYPLPLYVLSLDTQTNKLVVGTGDQLLGKSLIAGRINWISVEGLKEPKRVRANIRYRNPEADATLYPLENG